MIIPPSQQIHPRGYWIEPPTKTPLSLLTQEETKRLFAAVPTKSDYRDAPHRLWLRPSCPSEGQKARASGGVLTRTAPGSKESRLWPPKARQCHIWIGYSYGTRLPTSPGRMSPMSASWLSAIHCRHAPAVEGPCPCRFPASLVGLPHAGSLCPRPPMGRHLSAPARRAVAAEQLNRFSAPSAERGTPSLPAGRFA